MQQIFFLGVLTTLALEGLAYIGAKAWRQAFPRALPQPVVTDAQRLNEQAFDELVANRAVVSPVRLQRRTHRSAKRAYMEEDHFEQ